MFLREGSRDQLSVMSRLSEWPHGRNNGEDPGPTKVDSTNEISSRFACSSLFLPTSVRGGVFSLGPRQWPREWRKLSIYETARTILLYFKLNRKITPGFFVKKY